MAGISRVDLINQIKKVKELGMSKLGTILLAGVLLFLLSKLLSGGNSLFQTGTKDTNNHGIEAGNDMNSGIGGAEKAGTEKTDWSQDGENMQYISYQEYRLKNILMQIEGVGEVDVMISLAASGEKIVLSDNPYSQKQTEESDSAGGSRKITEVERQDTTIFESENGKQTPFVLQEKEPEVAGVLVLAEGAEHANIRSEITEAVEALFGLPVHRIKVIKRRNQ